MAAPEDSSPPKVPPKCSGESARGCTWQPPRTRFPEGPTEVLGRECSGLHVAAPEDSVPRRSHRSARERVLGAARGSPRGLGSPKVPPKCSGESARGCTWQPPRTRADLGPGDVLRPGVEPARPGPLSQGRQATAQEVHDHHDGGQPGLAQLQDALQHRLQPRVFWRRRLPRRSPRFRRHLWQFEALVGVDVDEEPVPSPLLPLAAQHLGNVMIPQAVPEPKVAAPRDVRRGVPPLLPHRPKDEEMAKQRRRRHHPHEHFAEMREDRQHHDGVGA